MSRAEIIKNLLLDVYYDETSKSALRWKTRKQGRKINGECGSLNRDGYWQITVKETHILIHRLVFALMHGELPDEVILDHLDGNRKNNKIANLREATRLINMRNMGMLNTNNSGVTGVCYEAAAERWVASWRDSVTRKQCFKKFPIAKYGDEAFALACKYRTEIIDKLNSLGAGYTDRHGVANG